MGGQGAVPYLMTLEGKRGLPGSTRVSGRGGEAVEMFNFEDVIIYEPQLRTKFILIFCLLIFTTVCIIMSHEFMTITRYNFEFSARDSSFADRSNS